MKYSLGPGLVCALRIDKLNPEKWGHYSCVTLISQKERIQHVCGYHCYASLERIHMCAVPMAPRAFFQLVPSLPWVHWTVHIVRYSKTIGIMKRISNTAAERPLHGSYMTPSYCVLTWWKCEGSLQNLFCKSRNSTHEGSNFMTW